jgi:hypothetical protein
MLVSAREAAEMLGALRLSRQSARAVLAAGLAGPPLESRGALLYPRGRILELVRTPFPDRELLARLAGPPGEGILVLRLGPASGFHVELPRVAQREIVSRVAGEPSVYLRLRLRLAIQRLGFTPCVATIGGFVVYGGDVTAVQVGGPTGPTLLELAEPGGWYDDLKGRRFPTGPGSAFRLWRPRSRPRADPLAGLQE